MLKNLFKLDLRSLALARVLLGILAFFDITTRIPNIRTFFSDEGILPRSVLLEHFSYNWKMSLLTINGSYTFALVLALVGALSAITFTLGWRTRISNAVVWITIISFQARFPEGATSGGDMLMRIFLFWSLFLPMSARYSIDRAVTETDVIENEYFSVFSTMWIVQIMLLYILTFLFKWAPVYHTDFDAVWYILQLDIYTTPFGKWLGQYYLLTKFLSFASYALEIVGPLLLMVPFKRDIFRGLAVLSFWSFHTGIGLTMHLGNFVPICLIIWVGLIPTSWWDYLAAKTKETSDSVINLYYDAKSDIAKKIGLIAKELLLLQSFHVIPSDTGRTYTLEDKNKALFTGSSILPQIFLSSKFLPVRFVGRLLSSKMSVFLSQAPEAGSLSLNSLAESVDRKSNNYFLKGMQFSLRLIGFDQVKIQLNLLEKILGCFLLALVIGWNIEGYVEKRKWYIGSPFDEIMFAFQLNQGWAMFAPHPQRSDGWWVMDGLKNDGSKWDALNNREVNFDRPQDIYETYADDDWRKFLDNIQASRNQTYMQLLGKHLCRSWNAAHVGKESLKSFQLYYLREFTKGPKEPPAEVDKFQLWNHSCY